MGPLSHYRTRAIVGKMLILLGCVIFVKGILRVWGGERVGPIGRILQIENLGPAEIHMQ